MDESLRPDGTKKGNGWLGQLKRPDGKVSTELTVGVDVDDEKMDIPLIVPTLDKDEINHLLSGGEATDSIMDKAIKHAMERKQKGRSPYIEPQDEEERAMKESYKANR